jgi:hypothetical protein
MHRHGSRGPVAAGEMNYIDQLVQTLEAHAKEIKEADLPPKFAFLKTGYNSDLNPEQLTPIGRKQLFDHGVEYVSKLLELTSIESVTDSDSDTCLVLPSNTPTSQQIPSCRATRREWSSLLAGLRGVISVETSSTSSSSMSRT